MTGNTSPLPSFAVGAINLASARLGAKGVFVTDDFFAPLDRMLQDVPASFDPDLYDDNGKYMERLESRRKRVSGARTGPSSASPCPGRIFGFDVDTSYFTGNYPPPLLDRGRLVADGDPTGETQWTELLANLRAGAERTSFLRTGCIGQGLDASAPAHLSRRRHCAP